MAVAAPPPVSEKPFDDYHLYTLKNAATLADRESKQVEFIRVANVATKRIYVYDGAQIDSTHYQGWNYDMIRQNPEYGSRLKSQGLDHARVREQRGEPPGHASAEGQSCDFTGAIKVARSSSPERTKSTILRRARRFGSTRARLSMSPASGAAPTIRSITRTGPWTKPSRSNYAITNPLPVEVRVVEHLYRGTNWKVAIETDTHANKDSQTIEYRLAVNPEVEKVIKYSVHYTW